MTDILESLSGDEALSILRNLAASNPEIHRLVLSEAEKVLSEAVDYDEVAGDVFFDLDTIQVEDLWDRAGANRYGYSSPEDTAVEMVEEVVRPHRDKIHRYRENGLLEQSGRYCMGLLKGLYQFDQESKSEFKDWASDVPADCFKQVLHDWRRHCGVERDVQEMHEFIARECPKWAK